MIFFFKGKTIVFRDIDLNDKSIKKYKEVIARVITWEGGTEGVKSGGAHWKDSGWLKTFYFLTSVVVIKLSTLW